MECIINKLENSPVKIIKMNKNLISLGKFHIFNKYIYFLFR